MKQAEAAYDKAQPTTTPARDLPPELKAAFTAIGQKLPELWPTKMLSQAQKKALLRCLIDKVVIHRRQRDQVRTRLVWKGGDITTVDLPIPVGSLAELSQGAEMESRILTLCQQGLDDQAITRQLMTEGYRSPMRPTVLLSTGKGIRLRHRLFRSRSQSYPRHVSGYLTVPQIAQILEVPKHWIYDRIHKGTIVIARDAQTGLYLFPDTPNTLEHFKQLKAGLLYNLHY